MVLTALGLLITSSPEVASAAKNENYTSVTGDVTTGRTGTYTQETGYVGTGTVSYKFDAKSTGDGNRKHTKGTYSEKDDQGFFLEGKFQCLRTESTRSHGNWARFVVKVTNSSDTSAYPKGTLFGMIVVDLGPGGEYDGVRAPKDLSMKNCDSYPASLDLYRIKNGDIDIHLPTSNRDQE